GELPAGAAGRAAADAGARAPERRLHRHRDHAGDDGALARSLERGVQSAVSLIRLHVPTAKKPPHANISARWQTIHHAAARFKFALNVMPSFPQAAGIAERI